MLDKLNSKRITFSEYFSMSKKIFIDNFKNLLFIGILIYLPFIILNTATIIKIFEITEPFYNYIQSMDFLEIQVVDQFLESIMIYLIIILIIDTLFKSISKGAMVYITDSYVRGEEITKSGIIKNSLSKIVSLFFTRLLYILLINFTLITIILPIYFGIKMLFYCEQNILEDKKPFSALKSSSKLVSSKKGRFFDVFNFYSTFYILYIIANILLSWIFASFKIYGVIGSIIGNIMFLVFLLFFSIPVTLKYINIRNLDSKN